MLELNFASITEQQKSVLIGSRLFSWCQFCS